MMQSLCILALILYSVVSKGGVDATTCTSITDFTCPTTEFSTGVCGADGNCECVDGYSPDENGCRQDLELPVVGPQVTVVLPYTDDSVGFRLGCTPDDKGNGQYTWLFNGTVIVGAVDFSYSVQEDFDGTSFYSCQFTEGDRTSLLSDDFGLIVVPMEQLDPTDPNIQPNIEGMPTILITGTELTITCVGLMFYRFGTSVTWSIEVPFITLQTHVIQFEVIEALVNTTVTCHVRYFVGVDTTVFNLTANVIVPELSDNIPGIHVEGGDERYAASDPISDNFITLTCAFDPEDFVSTGLDISWEWYVNNTITSFIDQQIMIGPLNASHHGFWHCTAQLGMQDVRESSPVFVHVDYSFPMSLTSSPTETILNGYVQIECVGDLPADAEIEYHWLKDNSPLLGYVDHTLYMNNLSSSVGGLYKCEIAFDELIQERVQSVANPILFSVSTPPTLTINSMEDILVFGETYQLTCEIELNSTTPGIEFLFLQDGVPSTVDAVNDSIAITGNVTNRTFTCQGVFNSLNGPDSNAISVSFSVFDSVSITDEDDNNITSVDAVVGTFVTFKCVVTLHQEVTPQTYSVIWYEDGTDLSSETDETLIVNVAEDHQYSCEAELGSHTLRSSPVSLTSYDLMADLSLVDNAITQNLDFQQTYHLRCNASNLVDLFHITYTFLRDGIDVVTNSSSETYAITNDLINREYTCILLHQAVTSPSSNVITPRFEVFDSVEIHDSDGSVITSIDGIIDATVSLTSSVTLQPGVPGQPTITWYDQDLTEVGTGTTLVVSVTDEPDISYFYNASLESYWMRSSDNVTITPHEFTVPVLRLNTNISSDGLNFSETYTLHCDVINLAELFDLTYTFLRDEMEVVTNSSSKTYTVTNDLFDEAYTCIVLHQALTTSPSNGFTLRFDIFDTADIKHLNGSVITSIDGIIDATVTLTASVTLLPDIPGQPTITWYDQDLTEIGTGTTLVVFATDEQDISYFYNASLESYWMRSSNNVTIIPHELTVPMLSLNNNISGEGLNFSEIYTLHCDLINLAEIFDLTYTFLRDGMEVVTNSSSKTYTVTNDLLDEAHTCIVLHQALTTSPSNGFALRFDVFDSADIKQSNGSLITSIDGVLGATVTLAASVTLQPGVPGQPTITWYDQDLTEVGTGTTLVVSVTDEPDISYFYNASLESYWMRSSNNVTIIPHELTVPALILNNNISSEGLNFSEIYILHCDVINLAELFDLTYTFLRDGMEVVTNSSSKTYTVTNDLLDKAYTCIVLHQALATSPSNGFTLRFVVFDTVDIHDVDGNVNTSTDAIINATWSLMASVSLQPGVPGQPTITWYDQNLIEVGTGPTLDVFVTDEPDISYFYNASLGSYWMRSSNNVTIIPHELTVPVLRLNNNISGEGLNFSEAYTLHCDVGAFLSSFALEYSYLLQDGTVIHTDTNSSYTISNDATDRQYSCKASFLTATSPTSKSISTSFEVFGGLEISLQSVVCHMRLSCNPIYRAIFLCNVTLLPGVPDQINYLWYDEDGTPMTSSSTFEYLVQGKVETTITCQAQIGSLVVNASLPYKTSSRRLRKTIPCSSCCLQLSLTLLLSALIFTCDNLTF